MRYLPLLLLCASCFLLPRFQTATLSFPGRDGRPLQLLLPRGFHREMRTDSAGRPVAFFQYAGGAELYIARGPAEGLPYPDTTFHIAQPHPRGGRFFKGQEADREFWREVHSGGLRLGYRNVPSGREAEFDSALNYVRIPAGY